MSQQGDAFVRRVLKGDPEPIGFREALQYLRQRGGSGRGAARLAGVGETSLRRWAAGTTPREATQQRVIEAARRERTSPSRMGDAGVILPIVSRDRKRGARERDVSGGQLQLQPGTLRAAQEKWISTGDSDAALRTFVGGIGEPWYRANLAAAAGIDDIGGDEYQLDTGDYGMSIG